MQMLDVIGVLITILLAINAFFVKDLVRTINEVKLQLMRLITQHDNTADDVKENKEHLAEHAEIITRLRERVHSLEGGQAQFIQYLKDDQ